jgi:hypothetical protein
MLSKHSWDGERILCKCNGIAIPSESSILSLESGEFYFFIESVCCEKINLKENYFFVIQLLGILSSIQPLAIPSVTKLNFRSAEDRLFASFEITDGFSDPIWVLRSRDCTNGLHIDTDFGMQQLCNICKFCQQSFHLLIS